MLNIYNYFLIFSSISITSALFAVFVTNPIHGILYLILTFLNTACILFILKLDFFALCLITVYVGAVAILFLFVIMMVNIKKKDKPLKIFIRNKFFWGFCCSLFISFFFIHFLFYNFTYLTHENIQLKIQFFQILWPFDWIKITQDTNVLDVLGKILYTKYFIHFIIASLLLFIAMIASIILTMQPVYDVERQQYAQQMARDLQACVFRIKRYGVDLKEAEKIRKERQQDAQQVSQDLSVSFFSVVRYGVDLKEAEKIRKMNESPQEASCDLPVCYFRVVRYGVDLKVAEKIRKMNETSFED